MAKTYASLDGFYSFEDVEKIRGLMQWKTYMHFDVYASCAGGKSNCTICVCTEYADTNPEDLKGFFTWCLVNELAERL